MEYQNLSNEDRLFMSQPPCVKLQPSGGFILTVEAGKVISYRVDTSDQMEKVNEAFMAMNVEVEKRKSQWIISNSDNRSPGTERR